MIIKPKLVCFLPYYEKKGLLSKINGQEDMKDVSENIDLIIKQVIGY